MVDPRNETTLSELLCEYNQFIRRDYLSNLKSFSSCKCSASPLTIKILKIKVLTTSNTSTFYTYILNALGSLCNSIAYIIHSTETALHLYIALRNDREDLNNISLLKNGLLATFPGSQVKEIPYNKVHPLLEYLFSSHLNNFISAASLSPSTTNTLSPLDTLIKLMKGEKYTALFLAQPMCPPDAYSLLNNLYTLYNNLVPFRQFTHNFTRGLSKGGSTTNSTAHTDSNSNACTNTTGNSFSQSQTHYDTFTPSASLPISEERFLNISVANNHANSCTTSCNTLCAECITSSHSEARTISTASNSSTSTGEAQNFGIENKCVLDALSVLNNLITNFNAGDASPIFCFAAYFLSPLAETATRAAYTYTGLTRSESPILLPSFVNNWACSEENSSYLLSCFSQLNHPCFTKSDSQSLVTASIPINSTQLFEAVNLSLQPNTSTNNTSALT